MLIVMGCIGLLLTSTRVVFIQISISKVLVPKADSLHFMRGLSRLPFFRFASMPKEEMLPVVTVSVWM